MNVKGFSEIVLIVNNITKSKKFYEDVVGLSVENYDKEWVWFYVGDRKGNQRLAIHKGKLLFEEKSPLPE
jgi:catechol 2,3-dioxygenase-like lactoylglutathione lyase family enzyme